jgi:hypothetical protein
MFEFSVADAETEAKELDLQIDLEEHFLSVVVDVQHQSGKEVDPSPSERVKEQTDDVSVVDDSCQTCHVISVL